MKLTCPGNWKILTSAQKWIVFSQKEKLCGWTIRMFHIFTLYVSLIRWIVTSRKRRRSLLLFDTGCPLNIVFFSKNSRKFATSPSPALGCYWLYKNYQPIGVAVHSHCVRALKVSYSDVGKGGVAENCEKTQFFLITLYIPYSLSVWVKSNRVESLISFFEPIRVQKRVSILY